MFFLASALLGEKLRNSRGTSPGWAPHPVGPCLVAFRRSQGEKQTRHDRLLTMYDSSRPSGPLELGLFPLIPFRLQNGRGVAGQVYGDKWRMKRVCREPHTPLQTHTLFPSVGPVGQSPTPRRVPAWQCGPRASLGHRTQHILYRHGTFGTPCGKTL